jgi:hypothetical protein
MKLKLEPPVNPNYAATVVVLRDFVSLANCSNVKGALIYGNQVIVGNDAREGDVGLYFPVETQLSESFLRNNNLYRPNVMGAANFSANIDPSSPGGFFEANGRVRCMKFRGHKSEGFFVPLEYLFYIWGNKTVDALQALGTLEVGATFDKIGDVEICRKYVRRVNPAGAYKKQGRKAGPKDRILDGQFHFHIDTEQLRRNIHKILPTDIISITDKWHGTSAIYANILVKKELKWYERALKWIGINVQETEYSHVWSSRRVIKGVSGTAKADAVHFYSEDIWGIVGREIFDRVPRGITVYGEIVGYTPSGEPIQPGYHYGCAVGTHKFLVYRVTNTNVDGVVTEYSWPMIKGFCAKYNFEHVKEHYYGIAGGLNILTPIEEHADFEKDLLFHLEKYYVNDSMCPWNDGNVPAEGVVVRVEKLDACEAYKLKNFKFLERESKNLDNGVPDMEELQGEDVENEMA